MKKVSFIIIALLWPSFLLSQISYRVSGVVIDSLSVPIAGAVVQLSAVANSTLSVFAISDQNGVFTLSNVPAGEFALITSHISYQSKTTSCSITGDVRLSTIVLTENVYAIEAVTVSPNNLIQSIDRYTALLRNDPITKGKTTSEVLAFLPAVSNREGQLKIFGQDVSRVRINGVLIEDRKELDAIQADNIDNVEIVYISGVNDMAAGSGGEINIKLKKTNDGGFYGSLMASTTINYKYGNTLNEVNSSFNYGFKKWSIYNYISYNDNNIFLDNGYLVHYLNTGQSNHQADKERGWSNYFADRLSITYDIAPKHLLGANLRYSRSISSTNFYSLSRFTDRQENELDRSRSEYLSSLLNNQYQASLHYKWKISDKGSEFNMRGDYLRYETDTDREYGNTYKLGLIDERVEYMNSVLDNKVDMYYVDAKFSLKTNERGKLEAGLNYNANRTRQILEYTDLIGGSWVTNNYLSDNFTYQGDNYAAFASLSSMMGQKLTYEVGLRGERREMSYGSVVLGLKSEKSYNILNAQANLMYILNPQKGRTVMLTIMKRTNDIPYSAITPAVTYLDEYTYIKGNVDMKPTTLGIAMLNFVLNKSWIFQLRGGFANNMQYSGVFVDPNDPRITYIMPINAGKSVVGGYYAEYKFRPSKWWRASVDILRELMRSDTPDGDFTSRKWQFNIKNNFDWSRGWGGTLNLYCELPYQAYANRRLQTELLLGGNVYKVLLNNKLYISLQSSLFSIARNNIVDTPEIWRKFDNDKHRYRLTLSLTYNFSGGKKVSVKQTSGQQSYNDEIMKATKK